MIKTLFYSVISVVILYLVEQHLEVNYLIKTIVKIGLFCIIPVLLVRKYDFLKWSRPNTSSLLITIGIALSSFLIIIFGYNLLQSFIDPAAIVSDLTSRLEISKTTFIFVAIYICLCKFHALPLPPRSIRILLTTRVVRALWRFCSIPL